MQAEADFSAGADASQALGALLLAAAGAARGCGQQPELLLRAQTQRFIERFERMERDALAQGVDLAQVPREQMAAHWARSAADEAGN